jgi:hypothetical protein
MDIALSCILTADYAAISTPTIFGPLHTDIVELPIKVKKKAGQALRANMKRFGFTNKSFNDKIAFDLNRRDFCSRMSPLS